MEIFESLQQETGYEHGLDFKRGGYLILAYKKEQAEGLEKNVALQRRLGLDVRLLEPEEAREIVPILNTGSLLTATYHDRDAQIDPFHTTHAFAEAARRSGVEIQTQTRVTGVLMKNDMVRGVVTDRGVLHAPRVLNAAGYAADEVGRMAGVEIPIAPERLEGCVTEPVEPMIDPLIVSFDPYFLCSQRPNGTILLYSRPEGIPEEHDRITWQSLYDTASKIGEALPPLVELNIIRQWVGLIPTSPDEHPIIGAVPGIEGLFLAVGMSGQGFMLAPILAKITAQIMLGKEPEIAVDCLDLGRFERGEALESLLPLV
jgi:sarcosine oxidase subunit beta